MIQRDHDRIFHPDVFGLSRWGQLRHFTFHAGKITESFARLLNDYSRWPKFASQTLPDLLVFGIKLSTVMGHRLPEEELR
jgi:hypothetical protein